VSPSLAQQPSVKPGRTRTKRDRSNHKPRPHEDILFQGARARAKRAGLPFTITRKDIIIPSHCPILGIPLFKVTGKQGGGDNSPSLDRIRPELGYVPGNVIVISMRANRIKSDATIQELRDIASFYATLRRSVRVTGAKTNVQRELPPLERGEPTPPR
jgi:hypothetical protein